MTRGRALRAFLIGVIALTLFFAWTATHPVAVGIQLGLTAFNVWNLAFLAWDIP